MLAACRGEPEQLSLDKLPASTRAPAPSSLLRFAREGGPARLYRVPSLEPSTWKAEDKLPPVEQVVGADAEQGLVFALDGKRNLVTLDLETRRVRTYLEQVRTATLGPDNALYAVDTGSTVTQMVRRAPIRFRNKLQGSPRQVYATMTGALLARVGDKAPVLEVLGSDRSPVSTTLPGEPMAPSFYGDLIAVATDTGVVLFQTQGPNPPKSIRLSGHPKAVLFSPSGHRLYVAQEDDALLILDRFSGDQLDAIDVPGPAKGLRGDRFGQWLLVQPASGDSAWVIDVGRSRLAGTVAARWSDGPPRRGLAEHAVDPSRQGSRCVGPGREGTARGRSRGRRRRGRVAAGAVATGPGCRGRHRHQRPRPSGQRQGRRVGLSPGQQLAEPGMGAGAGGQTAGRGASGLGPGSRAQR